MEYIDANVSKMVEESTNIDNSEIDELKKRYDEIWDRIRTDYTLQGEELEKLENEMFEIADKIENIN